MTSVFYIVVIITFVCINAEYISFEKTYEDGVSAYSDGDWTSAIKNIEDSLKGYEKYRSGMSSCSTKCSNMFSKTDADKSYLLKISSKGLCVKDCLSEQFGDFKVFLRVSKDILSEFENLMPYQYLQYAYFQNNMLSESVSAAYTYNLRFPKDEMMSANMKYFRESGEVTNDMFINREAREYMVKYSTAVEAYSKEDYGMSVKLFEEALLEYHNAVDHCYGFCEGTEAASNEQWDLNFYQQNAHHYVDVLDCSLSCIRDLSSQVSGHFIHDFLPLLYHYLQYGYYQLENHAKSAEYMMLYLHLYPNNTEMRDNLNILAEHFDISSIKPSEKILSYFRRIKLEVAMLQYSWNYFGMKNKDRSLIRHFQYDTTDNAFPQERKDGDHNELNEDEEVGYDNINDKTEDIISKQSSELEFTSVLKDDDYSYYVEPSDDVDISHLVNSESRIGYKVVDSKYVVTISDNVEVDPFAEGPLIFEGAHLLADSRMLKGRERFAIDGFSSEIQCQDLIDLAVGLGKPGDGYFGKESPHTEHEKFDGITVLDAALAAKAGNLPLSAAVLYYDLSERAKVQVQAYFHLPHLYFDYTHLVCRTAKSSSLVGRSDLSHPVHADNCLLNNNASCVKEPPAYIWRDYSAILYLNSDFDGGEFIFTDSTARRVRVNLKPKCGRLVSFGAGKDSLHGVKPVLHGRRCAIALWFTLSDQKKEIRREQAKDILDKLTASSISKDEL